MMDSLAGVADGGEVEDGLRENQFGNANLRSAGAWSASVRKSWNAIETEHVLDALEDRTKADNRAEEVSSNFLIPPLAGIRSPSSSSLSLLLVDDRLHTHTTTTPIADARSRSPRLGLGLACPDSHFSTTIGAAPDSAGSTATSFVGIFTPTTLRPLTPTPPTPATAMPPTTITTTTTTTTMIAMKTGPVANTMERTHILDMEEEADREGHGGLRPAYASEDVFDDYDYVYADDEEKEKESARHGQRRVGDEEEGDEERGEHRIRRWLEQQTGHQGAARADSPVLGFGFDEAAVAEAEAREEGKGKGREEALGGSLTTATMSKRLSRLRVPTSSMRRVNKSVTVDDGRDKPLPLVPPEYESPFHSLSSLYDISNRNSAILVGAGIQGVQYPVLVARGSDNSTATTVSTPETTYTVPSLYNSSTNDTPLRTPDAEAGYVLGFGPGDGDESIDIQVEAHGEEEMGSELGLGHIGRKDGYDKEATVTNRNKSAIGGGGSKNRTNQHAHSYSYSYAPYPYAFTTTSGSNTNSANHSRSSSLAAASPAGSSRGRGLLPLGVVQQPHQSHSFYVSYSQGKPKSGSISRSNSSSASRSRRTSLSSGSVQHLSLTHFPVPPITSIPSVAVATFNPLSLPESNSSSPKARPRRVSRLSDGVGGILNNYSQQRHQPVTPVLTTPTFANVLRTPSKLALVAARRSEAQQKQKEHQTSGSISSMASSSHSYSYSTSQNGSSRSRSDSYSTGGPSKRTSSSQLQQQTMTMVLPDSKELSRRPSVQAFQMRSRSQNQLLALTLAPEAQLSRSKLSPETAVVAAGLELVLSPASTDSSTTSSPSVSPSPSFPLQPAPPPYTQSHLRPRQTSSASLLSVSQQPQQLPSTSLLSPPIPASPLPPSSPPTRRQSRVPSISQVNGHEHAPSVSSVVNPTPSSTMTPHVHTHSRGRSRAGSMTLSSLALSMRALDTKSSVASLSSLGDALSSKSSDVESESGSGAHSHSGEPEDGDEDLEDDVLSVRNAVYIDSDEVKERLDRLLAIRSEVDLDEELELEFGSAGVDVNEEIRSSFNEDEDQWQQEDEEEDQVRNSSAAAVKTNTMYQTPYGSSSQVYIGPGSTSCVQGVVAPNAVTVCDTPLPANAVQAQAHNHILYESSENERERLRQSQSDLCSLGNVIEECRISRVQGESTPSMVMTTTMTSISTNSASMPAPASHTKISGSTPPTNKHEWASTDAIAKGIQASGFVPMSPSSTHAESHFQSHTRVVGSSSTRTCTGTTTGANPNFPNGYTNPTGNASDKPSYRVSSSSSYSSSSSATSGSGMSSVLGSYFLDNNSNSNNSHLDLEYFNSQISTTNIDNVIFNGTKHDNINNINNGTNISDLNDAASAGPKTAVAIFTGPSRTDELSLGALDPSCLPTHSSQHPFEFDKKRSNLANDRASKSTHININFASCGCSASGPGCGMMNSNMPGNVANGEFFFNKMPVLASYPSPPSPPSSNNITNMSTSTTTTDTAPTTVDGFSSSASMSMPRENQHQYSSPTQTHSRIHSASSSRSSDSQKQTSSTTPTRPPPAPPLDLNSVAVAMDVALSPVMSASAALLSPAVGLTGSSSTSASMIELASPMTIHRADEVLLPLGEGGVVGGTRQDSARARRSESMGLGSETGMMTSVDMSMVLDVEENMTFARTELSDSDDDLDGLGLRLRGVGGAGSGMGVAGHGTTGIGASEPLTEGNGEVEDYDYLSDDDGCASLLRGLDLKGRIAFPVHEYGYEDAAYVIRDGAGVVDTLGLMEDNASMLGGGGKLRLSMDSFAFGSAGYGHPQLDNSRPPMERSMSRWSLGSSDDGAEPESSRNSKETKKDKKDKKRNSRKSLVPSEDSGSKDLTSSFPNNLSNGNPSGSVSGKEGGVKKRGRLASLISRLSSATGTGLQTPPNSSSSSYFQFEGENIPPVPSTPLLLSSGMNSVSPSGMHTPVHTYTPADVLPPHTVVRGIWEATREAGSPPPSVTSFSSMNASGINPKPSLASITTNTMRSTMSITSKSVPSSPINQRRPSLSKVFIPAYPPPPPPSLPSVSINGSSKAPSLKSPSMSNMKSPSILLGKSSAPSIASNTTKSAKAKPLSSFKSASEGLVGMLSGTFFAQMQAPPSIYVAGHGDPSKRQPTIRGRSSSAADLLSLSSGSNRASRDQQYQYHQYQHQQFVPGSKNDSGSIYPRMPPMPTSPATPTRPSTPAKADGDLSSHLSLVRSKSTSVLRSSDDNGRASQSDHEHQLAYLDRSTDEGHAEFGNEVVDVIAGGFDEDDEDYGVVMDGKGGVRERYFPTNDEEFHTDLYEGPWVDDDAAPPVPPKEPASLVHPLMPVQQQQALQRPRLKSKTSIINMAVITSSSNSNSSTPMSPVMKSKGFRGFVQRIGMGGKSNNGAGSSGPSTPVTATFAQSGPPSSIEQKEARSSSGSSRHSPSVSMNDAVDIGPTETPLSPTLSRTQSKNMLLSKLSMPMPPPLTHSMPSSASGLPIPPPLSLNSPGPMSPLSPDSATTTTPSSPVEEYNTTLETTMAVSATIPTSLLNPSLNQTKTLGLNMNLSKPKKRKLLINGVMPEDYDAVKRWCEAFGEIKEIKIGTKKDVNGKFAVSVDFKKRDVADTVCRLQKQVFIKGVGSVLLSYHTNKNDPAI